MEVTCGTCKTVFDPTVRCPDCRQTMPNAAVDALARMTAAVIDNAPPALAKAILLAAAVK